MTAQTGRTTSNWVKVLIDNSATALTEIPVNTINGLKLAYDTTDLTAFNDAIHGILQGLPDFKCTIGGPFDTTATTGSHTVLSAIVGLNTPLTFDVRVGMRHAWETGEPQFGITGTAANGVLVTSYEPNLNDGTYTAEIAMASGSAAPAWGTAAET